MKLSMTKTALVAFAPLLAAAAAKSPVPGLPEIPDMPAEFKAHRDGALKAAWNATREKFPDADSAIVDDRTHVKYEADGTSCEWEEEWTKILTERGRREAAVQTMHFSQRYGDAAFIECEVFSPDGSIRKIATDKAAVSTDNSSMKSNIYDPLDKKTTLAVPGLATGDLVRVVTCRRTLKPRAKNFWADISLFEHTSPLLSAVFTVDGPAERPIVSSAVRNPCGDTLETSEPRTLPGGRILYSWSAKNVPQAHPEPDAPPLYTQLQNVRVSTARDWSEISRWYWNLCRPRLDKVTPAITKKTGELVRGLKTRRERMEAIFKFVSQEVRYMGLTVEDSAPGYEPHDVSLTFENRYGVCRDKAALLVAMLSEAAIPAFPVLIHASAKLDPVVPQTFFNHAIVAVEKEDPELKGADRYELLDPTDESTRELCPAYLCDRSFLVARESGETLLVSKAVPPESNSTVVESRGSLGRDGSLFLETRVSFCGFFDNIYRTAFQMRTPEDREILIRKIASSLAPGSEILKLKIAPENPMDTSVPLSLEIAMRAPGAVLRGKTRDSVSVPLFTEAIGSSDWLFDDNTALAKRRFALQIPFTACGRETVEIDLGGATGEPRWIPPVRTAGAGSGGFSFSLEHAVTNRTLYVRREWRSAAMEYAPGEYQTLKDSLAEAQTAGRAKAEFASRDSEEADIETIHSMREIHLASPHTYAITNSTATKILTYKGKKGASETTIRYNPAWGKPEIVRAAVTDAAGRRHEIQKHEINVMDAEWTGSAPRYSPSKILVLSLPAVEAGSVTEVVTAFAATNAPAPFAGTYTFDSENPARVRQLKIVSPADMPLCVCENAIAAQIRTNEDSTVTRTWSAANPPRIRKEPSQPPALLWRRAVRIAPPPEETAKTARALDGILKAARGRDDSEARRLAKDLASDAPNAEAALKAVRDGLRRRVRITGPGMWEVPLSPAEHASPDRVLADGYASKADYVNTLAAMLDAAGFSVEYLVAADDRGEPEKLRDVKAAAPDIDDFTEPFLRVKPGRNWLWPFPERPVWHVGLQNEYTPVRTCAYAGRTVLDPASGKFAVLDGIAREALSATEQTVTIEIGADKSATFNYRLLKYGPETGSFAKKWSEILPEDRRRAHDALVAAVSRNAKATGPLVADADAYPAVMEFSCRDPQFATGGFGTLSVTLGSLAEEPFPAGEAARTTPVLAKTGSSRSRKIWNIVFPAGWTKIETAPEPFEVSVPRPGGEGLFKLMRQDVVVKTVPAENGDGQERLVMTIVRETCGAEEAAIVLGAGDAGILREWNRRLSSNAATVVTVRKDRQGYGKSGGKTP